MTVDSTVKVTFTLKAEARAENFGCCVIPAIIAAPSMKYPDTRIVKVPTFICGGGGGGGVWQNRY